MFHKKVIVHISGGLGNQMFMYATARALSLRLDADLILEYNNTGKSDEYGRVFELDRFNIKGQRKRLYTYNYPFGKWVRTISLRLGHNLPFFYIKNFFERNFEFESILLSNDCPSVCLNGYWQSELYFKDFADQIKEDFSFKISFSSETMKELELIRGYGDRAVALCVRRYQEVKQFVNLKLTEKDYYIHAINEIKQKVKDPVFFCFSQVPDWVKHEIDSNDTNIIYLSQKTGVNSSHEDMFLLTHFSSFIISNSSYYWWGAWLARAHNKIVVSPNNWCCSKSNCDGWIIIE